jgi:4-nitrophenyl phosphatase
MVLDGSTYQAVLLDLDGTLCCDDHPLPGAVELIHRLQASKVKFACISNSTTSPQRVKMRLGRMGIDLVENSLFTAGAAACEYVVQRFRRTDDADSRGLPRVFNLANDALDEMLGGRAAAVQTTGEPCDAVIVGDVTGGLATPPRQRIALPLLRQGAALVGISADRVYPSHRGLEFGAGALTSMLAYAARVEPVFCGKPEPLFFQELCRRLGVEPGGCILIGDNLEADVLGGKAQGMRTVLTLRGVSQRRDVLALPAELRPDFVVEELTELL